VQQQQISIVYTDFAMAFDVVFHRNSYLPDCILMEFVALHYCGYINFFTGCTYIKLNYDMFVGYCHF